MSSGYQFQELSLTLISTLDGVSSIINQPLSITNYSNGVQGITGILTFNGPGTTLALTPVAATLTTGKIMVDVQNGKDIQPGDILMLKGMG